MGYLLFDGSNDNVTFPEITLPGNYQITLIFKNITNTGNRYLLDSGASGSSRLTADIDSAGVVVSRGYFTREVYVNDVIQGNNKISLVTDDVNKIVLTRTLANSDQSTRKVGTLFNRYAGTFNMGATLISMQIDVRDDADAVTSSYFYDPDASGGTGSVLPETTQNSDGTLNNFPTDDSQWVEFAAPGVVIDSTDATMQRGTNFEVVCSGATTAPTTANTTLSNGNDTLTPTSVTGSDPYTLTFPVGDLTKQVDATGYDWTLTVDAETDTTGNIPLLIQAGYTKVDLVNPGTTDASLLYGATGDAPVTGGDLEYRVTSVLDSGVTFGVAADAVWTITEANEGDWTTAITVSRRVVQADGTIGTEAVMTFDPSTGSGNIQAFRPFSFTKLIKILMEDGSYSGTGNTIIMNWLVDEGIKRTQLNEMFYKYLGNLGYTGNLNERIKQWENSAINNGFPYTIPFGLS